MTIPKKFKNFRKNLILAACIILAIFFFKTREGFQSTGLYTLLGFQVQNANVDQFLRSTTGYTSQFNSIKDLNGTIIWSSGAPSVTGSTVTDFIVYLNPQPPSTLIDNQTFVSGLKLGINSGYGSQIVVQFIYSSPVGTIVNESGGPLTSIGSYDWLWALLLLIPVFYGIWYFFIRRPPSSGYTEFVG